MNINQLPHVCLENVLIHLSDGDLHQCKRVSRFWNAVTHDAVKRQNREFRRSLLTHDLVAHSVQAAKNEITPRFSHSSCVFEGQLYVFGGSTKERNLFNDLWNFCLSTRTWLRPKTVGVYPSPKARASLLVYNKKLILFGGQSLRRRAFGDESSKLFSDVYEYDISRKTWAMVPPVSQGPSVSAHAACISGHRMIVFGGLVLSESHSLTASNDLWTFDLKSRIWSQIESPSLRPSPRCGHTLIELDEYHFLVLGGCGGQNVPLHDVWLLNLIGTTALWKPIIVRQSETMALQPKLHLNPVCKLSADQLIVLNFKQTPNSQNRTTEAESPPTSRGAVSLYFMDVSTVQNYGFVTWLKTLNKCIRGPDSVLLYSMHLTRNEIILFGGMCVREEGTPATSDNFPHVSNKLHVICSRKEVT